MKDLIRIGKKINEVIEAVKNSGLTAKELEAFENYITHQETIAPLLNPNFIQQHGFKFFDQAKERVRLLRPIIELKDKGV